VTALALTRMTRTRLVGGELRIEEVEVNISLSSREREVVALLALGYPNKAIARELWLSPHTVQNHIRGIFRKLGVENRTQAALRAYRLGLCDDEGGEQDDSEHSTHA
jgi:DNA-binding NarL/FixJ family response regulator